MATGPITRLSDIVVPEVFTPYQQQLTEQKSRLIASGAVVRDEAIDALLAGGGATFNVPSYKDLDDDEDNVSSDLADDAYTGGSDNSAPKKTGTSEEVAVRLNRNQSWSTSQLIQVLSGDDPAGAIASRTADYWVRRQQVIFKSIMAGVFADNAAAPTGSEHVQGDMTQDISGASYSAGVTDFSAAAFLDASLTLGDSQEDLGLLMVHSIVFNRMQKNNLIDFIPDARGETTIPTFLGRQVIVDDGMPNASGVFETWLFGAGAIRMGETLHPEAVETDRRPDSGNGGGSDVLYNRKIYCFHPVGYRYAGTTPTGGPSNAATANNLANAGSWQRVFPERKQIKIARLITRES